MKEEKICEEKMKSCCDWKKDCRNHYHGGNMGSPIYGLSVIGALFYFLQGVHGIWPILLGIGKAIVWPAILMFKLLTYLQL